MKKLLFFFFLNLTVFMATAQEFPSEMWHPGKLVLMSGDTIKGQIKYDFVNDMVQVQTNKVIKTYSSRKIRYFEIFDKTINSYRYFYALPYEMQSNYKVPVLFEVLYEGKLSLLCREEIVTENVPQYNSYPYYYSRGGMPYTPNASHTRLNYTYFFLEQNGEIVKYNMKKNSLLSFFKRKQPEVKQYMKKHHLKHDKMKDLVRLTAYYNALLGN